MVPMKNNVINYLKINLTRMDQRGRGLRLLFVKCQSYFVTDPKSNSTHITTLPGKDILEKGSFQRFA